MSLQTGHPLTAGMAAPLGAFADEAGANFAVFSENASRVELCLFSPDGTEETARIALPESTGPVWHGHVAGLKAGDLYGYRVHGPYAPQSGHRFNPHKLLLDPYARAVRGTWKNAPETLGYATGAGDHTACDLDSAPFVPKSAISAPDAPFDGTPGPRRPWSDTVIYEAHVKGLTRRHPDIPEDLRGTYEALGTDAVIDHLTGLGVTALELMPVHAFLDDGFLLDRGLTNYWGYNSLSFFALEPRYFGPNGAEGFRKSVDRLHQAGIEVILDVVYNHTAEGDHRGPTLSFRGLDNAAYYHLAAGHRQRYVNDTGCGNTVNVAHPFVLRMVLDSLRYWVGVMGVDGFRFDLATTLGREAHGFDLRGGFFDAFRQDPLLSRCKLIAEPWDIGPGGYRLGGFPEEWGEWNDRFRDSTRSFWRGDAHAAQEVAGMFLGSADVFDHPGRKTFSSVNFVAAHDGFTLADLTRYNEKHNAANGENNADGHGHNLSDNCGVEGDTDDPAILAKRARRVRNLLATVFLSQGTPMLLAGDEMGNTQHGNNNAYCQDNATSWLDWSAADPGFLAFTKRLAALRRETPVLRQGTFLHGQPRADGRSDVEWTNFDGGALNWRDPHMNAFCLHLRGSAECTFEIPGAALIVVNGGGKTRQLILPEAGPGCVWEHALDTAAPEADPRRLPARARVTIADHSTALFIARQEGAA